MWIAALPCQDHIEEENADDYHYHIHFHSTLSYDDKYHHHMMTIIIIKSISTLSHWIEGFASVTSPPSLMPILNPAWIETNMIIDHCAGYHHHHR